MILVVDDQKDILRVMLLLLKKDGFEATGVSSGREALRFLEQKVPHCVILDYNMPGMNGLEVLAKIRADPRNKDTSVILFSSQDGELAQQAFDAGANAFVRKDTLDWAKMLPLLHRYCTPSACPAPDHSQTAPLRDAG